MASSQLKNRMVHRCWLPLISGNKSTSAGRVTRTNWQGFSRSNCNWKIPPAAASGCATPAFRRVQPEQLRDASIAQRSDQREPRAEFRRAHIGGAIEPVGVVRQVKVAGTAGYGAAMFDGTQELRVAQRPHVVAADRRKIIAQFDEVRRRRLEPAGVDPCLGLVFHFSTFTCRSNLFQDFTLRESPRAVMAGISSRLATAARELQDPGDSLWKEGLGVEKFQAQEGSHALVQRLFVNDWGGLRLRVAPVDRGESSSAYSELTQAPG